MSVSVTDPIGDAFEWTKKVLFRPFKFKKWLVLGFCAFLASLGEGGCQTNFNFGGGDGSGAQMEQAFRSAKDWVTANPGLAAGIVAAVIGIGLALFLLLQWLSSRGKFMFLDGVVENKAAVSDPWYDFKSSGNSLFVLRVGLMAFGFFASLVVLGACALIAWPDIDAGQFGSNAVIAIFVGLFFLLPLAIGLGIVRALVSDFAVQVMYRRDIPALDSLRLVWHELVWPNVGTFVLFYLMKFVLGLAAGMLIFLATCLTCCLAALPYVSSVIFLPVSVFFRSYSVFFLDQFGDPWTILPPEPEPEDFGQEPPATPAC